MTKEKKLSGQLGNRNGLGKGRPPTSFTDEEVHSLGTELLSWMCERYAADKPPIHLTEWYFLEKKMLYHDWDALRNRLGFIQYYDSALEMMTLFTQKNSTLATAYGSRFLGVYSKDLREHEKKIQAEKAAGEIAKAETLVDLMEAQRTGALSQKKKKT